MPHKGRLPAEKKIELVEHYLCGKISAAAVMRQYGIAKKPYQ